MSNPKVIDESANPQQWTAVFYSYFSRRLYTAGSIEEAVDFLARGEHAGELSAVEVLGPDGNAVVPESEIFDACYGHGRWSDDSRAETLRAIGGAS